MKRSALLVHLALADVTNDTHGNALWCSLATLSEKTRLDRATVVRALDLLVAEYLLEETQRPGRTTLYRFKMPQLPVAGCDGSEGDSYWDELQDATGGSQKAMGPVAGCDPNSIELEAHKPFRVASCKIEAPTAEERGRAAANIRAIRESRKRGA